MESSQSATIAQVVRVVHFNFCPADEGCKFLSGPHLLVSTDTVPLKHGNAVAISYAWGEFSRRDVITRFR
jgi:hypothetical protein